MSVLVLLSPRQPANLHIINAVAHSPLRVTVLRKRVGKKNTARTQTPVLDVVGKGRYRIPLDNLDVSKTFHLNPCQRCRYTRLVHLLQTKKKKHMGLSWEICAHEEQLAEATEETFLPVGWQLGGGRNSFKREDTSNTSKHSKI